MGGSGGGGGAVVFFLQTLRLLFLLLSFVHFKLIDFQYKKSKYLWG